MIDVLTITKMFDGLREKLAPSESSNSILSDEDSADVSTASKTTSLLKGQRVLDRDEVESHIEDLRLTLLQNNVAMEVADEITSQVRESLTGETERLGKSSEGKVRNALQDALVDVLSMGQETAFLDEVADSDAPFVVMFTGVNGVGKTTSIAKLAQKLRENEYSVVIANGDTYRAGASEQMREHAENVETKLITHDQGADPTAVLYDAVEYAEANDVDVVLGDTAGRLHTSDDLMSQLEKMNRVVDPDKTIFVDESVAGQDAINRAQDFNEAAEINGVILTKADADSSGGAVLSLPYLLETPVYYLGTGQEYDDLTEFNPETLAEDLLNKRHN